MIDRDFDKALVPLKEETELQFSPTCLNTYDHQGLSKSFTEGFLVDLSYVLTGDFPGQPFFHQTLEALLRHNSKRVVNHAGVQTLLFKVPADLKPILLGKGGLNLIQEVQNHLAKKGDRLKFVFIKKFKVSDHYSWKVKIVGLYKTIPIPFISYAGNKEVLQRTLLVPFKHTAEVHGLGEKVISSGLKWRGSFVLLDLNPLSFKVTGKSAISECYLLYNSGHYKDVYQLQYNRSMHNSPYSVRDITTPSGSKWLSLTNAEVNDHVSLFKTSTAGVEIQSPGKKTLLTSLKR